MFSYYLQDRSYYFADEDDVMAHINQLNTIITGADEFDHFFKQKGFLSSAFDRKRKIEDFLYGAEISSYVQNRVLPMLFKRIKDVDQPYFGLKDMDDKCTKTVNAFLGPRFSTLSNRLLTTHDHYIDFRSYHSTHNVTAKNFVQCCKIALKHIVVLDDAAKSVLPIGKEAGQVFDDLLALDQYISYHWTQGAFDVSDVMTKANIIISDESETTKRNPKLKRTRYYNIPGIGGRYCFLHIKSGNGKRIHIYPEENKRVVYVTYIGLHKTSKKNT